MREILFRGKRIDNGEWVEGYYIGEQEMIGKKAHWILDINDYFKRFHYRSIDPDTIGQYTGLTDKNGKKIFEGDIIQDKLEDAPELLYNVIFKDGSFLAHQIGGIFDEDIYLDNFISFGVFEGAVISNIHDDSELLEETNEEAEDAGF